MTRVSISFSRNRAGRQRHRRAAAAAAVAGIGTAVLIAGQAAAFIQQTTVEGPIGGDIGGVWLAVQQILPEFRIQYPRPAEGRPVPFKVGPIPAELEPITGKNPNGVAITELIDAGKCAEYSLMAGDLVVKLNSTLITDVASFEKSLSDLPQTVVLTVRRPAIQLTTARLVKIKYTAGKSESEGMSAVTGEKADVRILDVVLPFSEKLDETRKTHKVWQPSEADIKSLAQSWAELPPSDPPIFMRGTHRLVAASNFDDALSSDETLKSSKLALIADLEGAPVRGAGSSKSIDMYGWESVTPQRIEGTYVTVTMAAAPFPINIEFKGRFVMTRVADWSDKDDQRRKESDKKPKENLDSYKLAPEVPEPAKP